MDVYEKEKALKKHINELGNLVVAFSGGVDSTYLLQTAYEVLGEKAAAITEDTPFFQRSELKAATDFAKERGIAHYILRDDEIEFDGIEQNPVNRCYLCKKHSFVSIIAKAKELGFQNVAEGTNADDASDYRPGLRAIEETGIISPLKDAGITKDEIRLLSKAAGLPTYNKPAYACLASRIPYGQKITVEKLRLIEAAEDFLHSLGFLQVRVRLHENLARVEVPEDEIMRIAKSSQIVYNELKRIGFAYVSLDLGGYKTGKMNEEILKNK